MTKPKIALKMTAVTAKMQAVHHHPERLTPKQEFEVAEADETLHRFVEGRKVQRIKRRIKREDQY